MRGWIFWVQALVLITMLVIGAAQANQNAAPPEIKQL